MKDEQTIIDLIKTVCRLNPTKVEDFSSDLLEILHSGKPRRLITRLLFKPLFGSLSFQGISDAAAISYQNTHGRITFWHIQRNLRKARRKGAFCIKLGSFNTYRDCKYQKTGPKCQNRNIISDCPVGKHDLLKGVLNIKAYSLYFYIRDVCYGDLISHIDRIIDSHENPIDARDALVKDFTRIWGVGDKLANMTLSYLLLSDPDKHQRIRVGQSMIAVDSLVHNFLHRTGILNFYNANHIYGPLCSKHCLTVLDKISGLIDAREFNPDFPECFPRFIQFSIWRFSSREGLGICSGFSIDDTNPCNQTSCPVYNLCDHITLKPMKGDSNETLDSGKP